MKILILSLIFVRAQNIVREAVRGKFTLYKRLGI
jgi:hypothetical protein